MRKTPDAGRKRFDLNVPQVAGSALAAVVAAKMASYFGVYGTILGAGVVSIVATCGGSVFQQFFRSTGEQLREARDTTRSRTPALAGRAEASVSPSAPVSTTGEFTDGTVYRAKVKSWKRPLLAAALVFGVTMGGITVYEAASGSSFSGGSGTTVSDAVGGRGSSHHQRRDEAPTPVDTPSGTTGSTGETPSEGGSATTRPTTPETTRTPGDGSSGVPGGDTASPAPTPSGSATDQAPATPEPSASSRSGTAVPDPAGSATP
ncbi:hypothetical protein ACPCI1_26780 [Streptomyces seoulensis]|uniref:hypothetical protein n=1 Tax=Streptomyces seoulensis TaxID=73044 RepID=UPI003C2B03A0